MKTYHEAAVAEEIRGLHRLIATSTDLLDMVDAELDTILTDRQGAYQAMVDMYDLCRGQVLVYRDPFDRETDEWRASEVGQTYRQWIRVLESVGRHIWARIEKHWPSARLN